MPNQVEGRSPADLLHFGDGGRQIVLHVIVKRPPEMSVRKYPRTVAVAMPAQFETPDVKAGVGEIQGKRRGRGKIEPEATAPEPMTQQHRACRGALVVPTIAGERNPPPARGGDKIHRIFTRLHPVKGLPKRRPEQRSEAKTCEKNAKRNHHVSPRERNSS
jgi:hypothetical protein